MSIDISHFGIDRLTVGDRLEIIEQIWNSLPENVSASEVPDWHLAEIARRRAIVGNPPGEPWREALDEIGRGRLAVNTITNGCDCS